MRTPRCPRCAYDLSGAVAAWSQSECPIEGTCSECGLRTLWRDILNPTYLTSEVFYETARRKYIRALLRTFFLSLLPWRLWRDVGMQFPVNPRRLIIFVILAVPCVWLLGALPLASLELYRHGIRPMGVMTPSSYLPSVFANAVWPLAQQWWSYPGFTLAQVLPSWIPLAWVWLLVTPLTFRLIPQTLRRAKVRRSHFARIWAYSLITIPLIVYAPVFMDMAMCRTPESVRGPIFGFIHFHDGLFALFILIACGATITLYWHAAAKHYLRLDHPRAVAIVLVALGGLATVTIAILCACISPTMVAWLVNELACTTISDRLTP
jgi:hypothetical protein